MVNERQNSFRWVAAIALMLCLGTVEAYTLADHPDGEFTSYYKVPASTQKILVSPTHYDWSQAAQQLTGDCTSQYQRIRAIYKWICRNIDYDTSYRIHTADSCIEQRRGVCQAYCELFYRLAEAVGVNVEIVSGLSRDHTGAVSDSDHAWLFAYTSESRGILLDPTWGAGTVNDTKFTRSKDCWEWFCVDPEWMILSHLPYDESYQLLDDPMTEAEFRTLPVVPELWLKYGLGVHELYEKARKHTLELPTVYTKGEGDVEVIDMPRSTSLKIGQFYTFRIRMTSGRDFAIVNNDVFCKSGEWKSEGNGIYSVRFMPRDTKLLSFNLKDVSEDYWNRIFSYTIEPPAESDWAKVEKYYPLCLPEVRGVKNLYADVWKAAGIDGHRLLSLIRKYHVKELPAIFDSKGQKLTIVSVPMTNRLKAGKSYAFEFYPRSGVKWKLVNNETWYGDWQKSDDGKLTMTIAPVDGSLRLYVQMAEGESYWSCLEYEVE